MDIRQLRYFIAVYEQQSLARAASVCNVAQSALSLHIHRLEAELDTRLFERWRQGMKPTESATRLLTYALAIVQTIAAASEDLRGGSAELVGDLAVGLTFTAVEAIAIPFMLAMQDRHPRVRLAIHEHLSHDTLASLLGGQVDFALSYNTPADARIAATTVLHETLCCVGLGRIVGESEQPIGYRELASLPMVRLKQGPPSRSISRQTKLIEGLYTGARIELNGVPILKKALVAGIGCAVCPSTTVRDLIERGEIVARPIVNPVLSRSLQILTLTDRTSSRMVETAMSLLCGIIKEEVNAGRWDARLA